MNKLETSSAYKFNRGSYLATLEAANSFLQVLYGRQDLILTTEIYLELLKDQNMADVLKDYFSMAGDFSDLI